MYGNIVKTTDYGVTWTNQNSGVSTEQLEKIYFPDNTQTGFAVGTSGTMLKTTNGGNEWVSQDAGTSYDLYGVHFPADELTGYIVGEEGFISKTMDGGLTWHEQSSGTSRRLTSVYFPVDDLIGYAAGEGDSVLKTTDGGVTWFEQATPIPYGIEDVHFPEDVYTGYAVGYGCYIIKTTNGGEDWVEIDWWNKSGSRYAAWHTVYFINNDVGYVGGTGFEILKTTNGMVSFEEQECPLGIVLDIHFPANADTGFAAGALGIIKTIFGGGSTVEENDVQTMILCQQFAPNPFISCTRAIGAENRSFVVWDVSGRNRGVYNGARIGDDLAPGVYFLQQQGFVQTPIQIIKVK